MDQGTAPDSAMWSLRSRGPAHAVSRSCLDVQASARPRGILARLVGADPLRPEAVGSYRRALAELRVAHLLATLGPDYRVLHAVPDGEQHIDHLLIGPPGVFAITTMSHTGQRLHARGSTLLVDGQRAATLTAAEREARAATRSLTRATGSPVAVTPVVVVVGARSIDRGEGTGSVEVLDSRDLVAWVRARPVKGGPDIVASMARAAEERTTWRPLAVELGATTDPSERFERLRRQVVGAQRIRILWVAGLVAALVIVAFGAASGPFS
jgi:hypothetical protein